MHSRTVAALSLVAVTAIWGSTFIVTKSAVEQVPPVLLAWLRFALAAAVLVPLACLRGARSLLPRPLPLGALLAMSVTGWLLYYLAFNYALVFASAAQGAIVQALIPAAVAAAAALALRERITPRRAAGIALSVAGVMLVVATGAQDGGARPWLGALLMAATVLSWAVYTVLAKRLAQADPIAVTAGASSLAALLAAPLVPLELAQHEVPVLTAGGWLAVVYLGVIASGVAFFLYGRALRDLDASLVAVYMNLVPIVGFASAVLVLGEPLGALQALGVALALTGVWLAS